MTPQVWLTSLRKGAFLRSFDHLSPQGRPPTREVVYIGRPSPMFPQYVGSPLANPYHLVDEEDRIRILNDYRWWMQHKTTGDQTDPAFQEVVRILRLSLRSEGVTLACWCAPKPCHGQVIREFVHAFYKVGWR